MSYNWLQNIIQIMPATHTSAAFTDEIGRLEWIPAAGTALYRNEEETTELKLFIFDVDGVATDPTDDVNFVGWFSGANRPTDQQINDAIVRLKKAI